MKIGELAERTGASIRSLRYYEEQGLLAPLRLNNGYREYSALAEEQVRTIQLYLNLGLSTEEIRGILQCVLKSKEAFCEEVLPIYRQKLAEIDRQIHLLTGIRQNLIDRIDSILLERNHADQEE
ncbi:DNA-binding transcriptional regulator, MerR family [Paenibacillus sp. UNCCL117]|uniref:MerR family transcriptional regulator n=1 Tax=unclassified Paenibacillus TaxID=185978 RepID=UPI0008888D66|nr:MULTISPECIES: MerR family transcriptional regulator [unclassified Paenibacillus]SDE01838.1 DNA-binding transcriptional regulator, MerR family [Paenibacillus sp. cl123]SFW57089.1 DNA-binding transcriptional regulator, MerR family [Paenibacillus sp. UNCCL117]